MTRPLSALACAALLLPASCSVGGRPAAACEIVAHRGASHSAPENTLAAFNLAWALGADAIEGDFRLTRDGHLVAMHDETTKRTAGVDLEVRAATLAELRELDVGSWKHERWAGERVPTLPEVLATVPAGRKILIELKCGPEVVPAVTGVVEAADLDRDQMVVIAFDAEVIAEVKRRMPWMKAYWVSDFDQDGRGRLRPTVDELIRTARRTGADGVDVKANTSVVDPAFVRALREAGLEVHVWTVNKAGLGLRMAALGVDSITTARPGWLREQLAPARAPG